MFKKLILFSVLLNFIGLCSCDINQTKEAKLPEIDLDVESGQLPSFNVDWAEVNVGTRTTTVTVPKIVVVTEEVEVEVPYVDVDIPNSGNKEELTLIVEAEVKDAMHKVKIMEVFASENNLYVISSLTRTGDKLDGSSSVRVSDRLVLNAPDLNIKRYVIGQRPPADHNKQFKYFSSIEPVMAILKKANAQLIYQSK